MEWINIKDKVPERETPVHVYIPSYSDEGKIFTASLCNWKDICNDWHFLPGCGYNPHVEEFDLVTHWMPLLEPPK